MHATIPNIADDIADNYELEINACSNPSHWYPNNYFPNMKYLKIKGLDVLWL